jgi:hypothetical protein
MALQTGAFALEQDVPNKVIYSDSNYTSTSDASLNRRHTRIAPRNDTTFQPGGTREIEFVISSSTSFIDFQNFYITGEFLNRTLFDNIYDDTRKGQLVAMLEKGGINSLFETVVLENASTGAVIDRVENYNTWCALMSRISESGFEGDECKLFELDSSSDGVSQPQAKYGKRGSSLLTAISGATEGAQLFLFANGIQYTPATLAATSAIGAEYAALLGDIQGGDLINFNGTGIAAGTAYNTGAWNGTDAAQDVWWQVAYARTLSGGERMIVFTDDLGGPAAATAMGAASGSPRWSIQREGSSSNVRAVAGSYMAFDGVGDGTTAASSQTRGQAIRFAWRPQLPFFKMKKYYPLFLHASGLRLRCILDPNAFHAFVAHKNPKIYSQLVGNGTVTFDYQIADCRLNMPVYDFHSSINKQYLESYKSMKGLLFPFKAVYYSGDQFTTANGQISRQLNVGVRSARVVHSRLTTDLLYSSSNKLSWIHSSINMHPSLSLSKYQFSSGSLVFPQREIELDDQFLMENRKHLWIAAQKHCDRDGVAFEGAEPYNAARGMSWDVAEHDKQKAAIYYGASAAGLLTYADSSNCIMSAILGREMEGRFPGLDLSIQPLKIDMTYDSSISALIATNRVMHTFIEYDRYLHLGESTGVTLLY